MLKSGSQIGDWIVEQPLAEGGMGSVFLCHNRMSERVKVALKVVKPHELDGAEDRFVREAEALYTLRDPSIVRVMGFGFDDSLGAVWLAMELVDGLDFVALLSRGAIEVDRAARLFGQIATGLAHAHAKGIQHRDIKPANLMVRAEDDRAVIVDFGISLEEGRTKLTAAGMVPGTMAYMAPEVFDGEPDPESGDIYALGLVLHEALSGEAAFPEDSRLSGNARMARLMAAKLSEKTFDPGPGTPDHLRELVRSATSFDRATRLPTMAAFAEACRGPTRANKPAAPSFKPAASQPLPVRAVGHDIQRRGQTPPPPAPGSSGDVRAARSWAPAAAGVGCIGVLVAAAAVGLLAGGTVVAWTAFGPRAGVAVVTHDEAHYSPADGAASSVALKPVEPPPSDEARAQESPATISKSLSRSSELAAGEETKPKGRKLVAAPSERAPPASPPVTAAKTSEPSLPAAASSPSDDSLSPWGEEAPTPKVEVMPLVTKPAAVGVEGAVMIFMTGSRGQTVSVDGAAIGTLPARTRLWSGPHVFIVMSDDGTEMRMTRDVKFNAAGSAVINLAP